jgi:hypothetical protein
VTVAGLSREIGCALADKSSGEQLKSRKTQEKPGFVLFCLAGYDDKRLQKGAQSFRGRSNAPQAKRRQTS